MNGEFSCKRLLLLSGFSWLWSEICRAITEKQKKNIEIDVSGMGIQFEQGDKRTGKY